MKPRQSQIMRAILAAITAVSCLEILISMHGKNGQSKSLNHALMLTKSNMKNKEIFWSLDYNEKKFRIRTGKRYLDMSSERFLRLLDGGKEIEDYDRNEKIKEINDLIDKTNGADKNHRSGETSSAVRSTRGQDGYGTTRPTDARKSSAFNDPIIPREGSRLTSTAESMNEYASQLIESDADSPKDSYGAESMLTSQYQSSLKEDEEEPATKDLHTDTKPKIELTEESKNASMLGTATKPNVATHPDRSTKGYVFSLIPVFRNKVDKRMLIAVDGGWCLTHSMEFKTCEFPNFWDLDKSFYWDIFKAENVGYLGKLVNSLMDKEAQNRNIKKASHTDLNACPSSCPNAECDTEESDDEDSGDLKAGSYNTTNRIANPQQVLGRPQMSRQTRFYPGIQSMQYGTAQTIETPGSYPVRHSPFSSDSVIIDRNLYEKLRQVYDRTTDKD